jgi:hypothetical protein
LPRSTAAAPAFDGGGAPADWHQIGKRAILITKRDPDPDAKNCWR